MGEPPIESTPAPRVEGEREPCLALASLGFPIVFLALLGHGLAIFVVRQGYWIPGPAGESAWMALVTVGITAGLLLSIWRGGSLTRS